MWRTLLSAILFAVFASALGKDCTPVPYDDGPCTFEDDYGTTVTLELGNGTVCESYPDKCCWDGVSCLSKQTGSGKPKKKVKKDVYEMPSTAVVSARYAQFAKPKFCPPPIPFPKSCKLTRSEPFVLNPPVDIPYCVRIPCSPDPNKQRELDLVHKKCGQQPGCYFDVELFELRDGYGPSVMPGVPVCHFAIRNSFFQQKALEVANMFDNWNPFFTNCLLKTYHEEIVKPSLGCLCLELFMYLGHHGKYAGWNSITPYHCWLIGACWVDGWGCFYEIKYGIDVEVKSGQRFDYNKYEVVYGRPKCQNFDHTSPYSILKSYHKCMMSGCTVDANIAAAYYQYLYAIGETMNIDDQWAFWDQVEVGKLGSFNLDAILWKFDDVSSDQYQGYPVAPPPPPPLEDDLFGLPPDYGGGIFDLPYEPEQPKKPSGGTSYACGHLFRGDGYPPCRPPKLPNYHRHKFCPYKQHNAPRYDPLLGSFEGCCEINACYLSKIDIRNMHSGSSYYYTEWSYFSPCSATCGYGIRDRYRKCISPNDKWCHDHTHDEQECMDVACGHWSNWSRWSRCRGPCGKSIRSRKCQPKEAHCDGNKEEVQDCGVC